MLFICQWLLFVKVMQSRHDVKWNVNFVWATHCYAQKKKTGRGWPRCRIYIYNYSHDTIISHHNSSARDVSSDREGVSHAAYQTAAWQAWHSAPGLVIYTTKKVSLAQCLRTSDPQCLSRSVSLCPPFPCRLSFLVWAKLKMRVLPGSARHSLWHSSRSCRDMMQYAKS